MFSFIDKTFSFFKKYWQVITGIFSAFWISFLFVVENPEKIGLERQYTKITSTEVYSILKNYTEIGHLINSLMVSHEGQTAFLVRLEITGESIFSDLTRNNVIFINRSFAVKNPPPGLLWVKKHMLADNQNKIHLRSIFYKGFANIDMHRLEESALKRYGEALGSRYIRCDKVLHRPGTSLFYACVFHNNPEYLSEEMLGEHDAIIQSIHSLLIEYPAFLKVIER